MPPSGLIGWWKLLDGSGVVAGDSSGNGFDGSLQGPPAWVTDGPNGGGLSFAGGGSENRVDVPRNATLEPTAVTGCCWFKVAASGNNSNQALIAKTYQNNSGPIYGSFQLGIKPNDVDGGIHCFIGGTSGVLYVDAVCPPDTWFFGAFTYDPSGLSPQQNLYLNGVLIASRAETTPITYDTTPTGDFIIGANGNPTSPGNPGNAGFFTGEISDVQLYNRALTADEIMIIYTGSAPAIGDISILRGPHRGSRITPPYNP